MSKLNTAARIIFCAIFVLFSFSANAFDFDGAWATDAANCGKVFVKRNNRISMKRHADALGGGFIVEDNQIRGALLTCKIIDRKEDSDKLHLLASCSTLVAPLSPMLFSIRIVDNDHILRVLNPFSEVGNTYTRCTI